MQKNVLAKMAQFQHGRLHFEGDADQFAEKMFPRDPGMRLLAKASVSPDTSGTWSPGSVGFWFVQNLRDRGVAFGSFGSHFEFGGDRKIRTGNFTALPDVQFVAQGAPIPVTQGALASGVIEPKKLATIVSATNELLKGGEQAQTVLDAWLTDGIGRKLDAVLFDDQAATAVRPAGLQHGASSAAAGSKGPADDLAKAFGAVVDGGYGERLAVIVNPAQLPGLVASYPSGIIGVKVVVSSGCPKGVAIVLDENNFISAGSTMPLLTIGQDPLLHMEDTVAAVKEIVDAGGTVAAPTRSVYQTDSQAFRVIWDANWRAMVPAAVAVVTGVNW